MTETQTVRLGDVAFIQQGKRVEHLGVGQARHPMYGANGVIGSWIVGTYDFGVVGLGCRGSVGTVHEIPAGAWLGNNVMGVWPKDERTVTRGFLRLALEIADLRAAGVISGQVQEQITHKSLAPLEIDLPPLGAQRRIVDLIGSLDGQIADLAAEQASLLSLLEQTGLDQLQLPGDGGERPLDSLFVRSVGGLWGDAPGSGHLDVAVFRSTEFTDFGFLSGPADAKRSITEKEYSGRALAPGDILVEKSGGTPTRSVGRVVRVDAGDLRDSSIGANFLQLLRVHAEMANPSYIFWLLWMSHRRGDAVNFQQASTNIRNLRTKEYLRRTVALPSMTEQGTQATLLDSLLQGWLSLRSEITSARTLRGRLLADLLSQEIKIPEKYDSLLEAV